MANGGKPIPLTSRTPAAVRSFAVYTAITPGEAFAAVTSMFLINACA
jgi:hypothetical protein